MLVVHFRMKTASKPAALILFLALLSFHLPAANIRLTQDFDAHWLFSRGDFANAMVPAFDDSAWQPVTVPHDWSSDGPFQAGYGSGNGFAPGGFGWYRKHFTLDASQKDKTVTLEFDGVYDCSEVWVNGQYVGGRPYGYSSFQCELAPYLQFGSADNVVAVRVDHSRFADSRYYTGSGIYRNVRLVATHPVHIGHDGIYVTTSDISATKATIHVETIVTNSSATPREITLQTEFTSPGFSEAVAVIKTTAQLPARSGKLVKQTVTLKTPQLWNVDSPKLYHADSSIWIGKVMVDEQSTPFGIRVATFDANKGFSLNGKSLKLKGVCLHHDAGPIGAAVPDKVLERRLLTLKEIGVNAIRTSHNPPDPALLDFCDRMGFLVMDEAFDEFTPAKNKWVTGRNNGAPSHFGYAELFDQWSVTDLSDMVRRDRNHPCIILWSIGNEIDFANDPFSHPVLGESYHPGNPPAENLVACAKPLIAAVKALDPTRPVTAALATVSMSDAVGLAGLLDAAGYNYQEARYADDHRKYPQRIIYGSENSHQYNAWLAVRDNDYIAGQFLWTGADYLGEANEWPNRASGAGLLDLCGFKKPLAWFRQSLWSDRPMVYLSVANGNGGRRGFASAESWNWPSNSSVNILCFANCPEVTLMLNDKVIGTKKLSEATRGMLDWQIPYEPGTLKAVGSTNGYALCEFTLKTAGPAARIELLPDTTQLHADAKDVSHIEFRIVDENGVRISNATPEITFELTGPANLLGIGNGDVNSSEDCKASTHHAFQGRGLAILQTTTTTTGTITLKATAPGLESATLTLQSR